jgi:hypothetical protein
MNVDAVSVARTEAGSTAVPWVSRAEQPFNRFVECWRFCEREVQQWLGWPSLWADQECTGEVDPASFCQVGVTLDLSGE